MHVVNVLDFDVRSVEQCNASCVADPLTDGASFSTNLAGGDQELRSDLEPRFGDPHTPDRRM